MLGGFPILLSGPSEMKHCDVVVLVRRVPPIGYTSVSREFSCMETLYLSEPVYPTLHPMFLRTLRIFSCYDAMP